MIANRVISSFRPISRSMFARRSFSVQVGEKRYTKSHEWVQLSSANQGRIGISVHAANELGDVVYVDLPDADKTFAKEEPFGSVESVKAASSVYAPEELTIVSVNEALKDDSGIINQDAEGNGWMIEVKFKSTAGLDSLMNEADYAKFLEENQH